MVAGAKDELTKLPLHAAARALVVLAASTHDGEGSLGETLVAVGDLIRNLGGLVSILGRFFCLAYIF